MQVRRQPFNHVNVTYPVSPKARLLEFAFISLAATNLFIVSSALAFYWLGRH